MAKEILNLKYFKINQITNKIMIIITGASDGLGLQLAKLFKEAGKTVVNISRRESEFADTNILCDLQLEDDIKKAARLDVDILQEKVDIFFMEACRKFAKQRRELFSRIEEI